MISHKRWPLLHYLGFKRQLGEFLGQLPRLKASMNSPPLRTQITVGHKVTKEGQEDDFLKSETAAKVRQVAAADCQARGWWRGVYLIFVVSWLVSWISASWELSRLHHSASGSWSPWSLIPSPSHQQQNPRHWHWSGASLPLSRFRLQMAGWHPAPATQNTLWQQRSQALLPNWIQSSIQIFTWQEWSFNRLD